MSEQSNYINMSDKELIEEIRSKQWIIDSSIVEELCDRVEAALDRNGNLYHAN